MTFDPLIPPPLLTADLPGIGGRIKTELEDFDVEEIPAYQPCGTGDYLYLWVEKRDMGAEFFARQVATRLDIAVGEVGTAGMKDRRAVTRQMVSVPATAEQHLPRLEGGGIRVLSVSRHGNKLKPGHLHGNRFRITIRGTHPDAAARLGPILERLRRDGMANFYGPQRFGRDGETVRAGLALLRGEAPPFTPSGRPLNVRNRFLRKLALSAAQSALFNSYLAERATSGQLRYVLPGDVMAKWPCGGLFIARDVGAEQRRLEAREIVPAGPIFGRKMLAAAADAAAREKNVLTQAGLSLTSFAGFGKLLQGTRRHNLVYLEDLAGTPQEECVYLTFTLPAGSYATVLLREVTKSETATGVEEEL
jgi:tRNA pseudouridine13 synthase